MHLPAESRSRVIVCRGALATERCLLEEIRGAQAVEKDLTRPVRIIVPSKSLRQHLLVRLAREKTGRVGVIVQTAYSAAREILRNARAAPPTGDAFFDVVVRRLARGEEALVSNLEELDDGYGTVVGVVRDLLDAGFQPAHEDAVLDRLDDLEKPVTQKRLERARSIVRIAAGSYEAMLATDSWRSAQAFETARGALLERGDAVLPTSTVLIHGFADVTGLVADFLESLVREFPSILLIDRPDRPDGSGRVEPGVVFLERLDGRFGQLDRDIDSATASAPQLDLTQGGDVESEMRWVAERARALIDEGGVPEEIGIVTRQFEALAYPLRRHLRRLGVPYSGIGERVAGGGCRRAVLGLAEVLRAGPATPVDLWIESLADERMELLLALRQIGIVRLEDLAALRIDGRLNRGVRIAVAIQPAESECPSSGRVVSAAVLRDAQRCAASLLDIFETWPDSCGADSHFDRTVQTLLALGWTAGDPVWNAVFPSLRALAGELVVIPDLERHEWRRLLADGLAGLGDEPIGGEGGGVQLLTVTEARARTFTNLFLVGFNRGVFPRVASDDSLLPDAIRARLALDVLLEMPVRARSADEERYLFAQLASSAPEVHISWHLSALGSVMTRSPFVADIVLADAPDPLAPPLWSTARADLGSRPPYEHAILMAAAGSRKDLPAVLAEAITAADTSVPSSDALELAEARIDILEQVEPSRSGGYPNPWFGFVGGVYGDEEKGPAVTAIEGTAECPWANFVTRVLSVAPLPDPQIGLPDPRGRLVGEVVHRVLENVVRDAVQHDVNNDVGDVANRIPSEVPWPTPDRYATILAQAAREVATEAGLGPLGMSTLLAARSRPYLEVACRVDWEQGGYLRGVLAPEVSGVAQIEGVDRPLRFRADRVNRDEEGLCLTDYKTSGPVSDAKTPPTRRKHLLKEVQKGRMLQATVYAAALPEGEARGRYLWLKPDIGDAPEEARWAVISGMERDFETATKEAVAAVDDVRKLGVVFPRVEEVGSDQIPDHCKYCGVAEVCRRDDSGYRRRLVAWMENDDPSAGLAEGAARALWHLGAPKGDD